MECSRQQRLLHKTGTKVYFSVKSSLQRLESALAETVDDCGSGVVALFEEFESEAAAASCRKHYEELKRGAKAKEEEDKKPVKKGDESAKEKVRPAKKPAVLAVVKASPKKKGKVAGKQPKNKKNEKTPNKEDKAKEAKASPGPRSAIIGPSPTQQLMRKTGGASLLRPKKESSKMAGTPDGSGGNEDVSRLSPEMQEVLGAAQKLLNINFFDGYNIPTHTGLAKALREAVAIAVRLQMNCNVAKVAVSSRFEGYCPSNVEIGCQPQDSVVGTARALRYEAMVKLDNIIEVSSNCLTNWRNYLVARPEAAHKHLLFPHSEDLEVALKAMDETMVADVKSFLFEAAKSYLQIKDIVAEVADLTADKGSLQLSYFS